MRRTLMCLTAVLLLAPSSLWLTAQEPILLDSANYDYPADPTTSPWLPDPTVWTETGMLNADNGTDGLNPMPSINGLGIHDAANYTSRLYTHVSPALASPSATASIRALSGNMNPWAGASHWDGNRLGWRLVLDDGAHRLELALARVVATDDSPRFLEVIGAPAVPLIPFPWANGSHAWYEISRAANGDFVISVTDTASPPAPPVEVDVPASLLPPSRGTASFAWGSELVGGTFSFWFEVQAEVYGTPQSSLRLNTRRLSLNYGRSRSDSEIEWVGTFAVPAGERIDLATEPVLMKFENTDGTVFEATIPAGRFTRSLGGYRLATTNLGNTEISGRLIRRSRVRWDFEFDLENVAFKLEPRTLIKTTLGVGSKVGTDSIRVTRWGSLRSFRKPDRSTRLSTWWMWWLYR